MYFFIPVKFRQRNDDVDEPLKFHIPTINNDNENSVITTLDPYANLFSIEKIEPNIDSNEEINTLLDYISSKESDNVIKLEWATLLKLLSKKKCIFNS